MRERKLGTKEKNTNVKRKLQIIIGEIADRIARSENVDNQLEVKPTNSGNN